VLGVVYLEAGLPAVRAVIARLLGESDQGRVIG
jgi:hypothetical protein